MDRKRQQVREEAFAQMELTDTRPSVAELESGRLEELVAAARGYGSSLIVSWSDDGPSYEFLKLWAASKGIAFADWVPRTNSVRAGIPALPLDNNHSGGHHRGWTQRLIGEEFARQIRANQR